MRERRPLSAESAPANTVRRGVIGASANQRFDRDQSPTANLDRKPPVKAAVRRRFGPEWWAASSREVIR